MSNTDLTEITCCRCDRVAPAKVGKNGPKLPKAWKRGRAGEWCPSCWRAMYVLRSIRLPIVSPVDIEWEELRERVRVSQNAVRSIANWAYRELLKTEPGRSPGDEKLVKRSWPYLYGQRDECPGWNDVPTGTSNAVLQQVQADYASDRFDLVWRGVASARNYGEKQPIPLASVGVSIKIVDDQLQASINLAGKRISVKLGGGRRHRRQNATLRMVAENPELMGAAEVVEKRKMRGEDDGQQGRENSGGTNYKTELYLCVACWLPKTDRERAGTLHLRTDKDSFIVGTLGDEGRIWRYNLDQVLKIIRSHERHLDQLQRYSEDRKFERRRPNRDGRDYAAMVSERARKDKARMRSLVQQIASHCVSFAYRSRVQQIIYDDSYRGRAKSFPWAELRTALEQRANAEKIDVIFASGEQAGESPASLAVEQA